MLLASEVVEAASNCLPGAAPQHGTATANGIADNRTSLRLPSYPVRSIIFQEDAPQLEDLHRAIEDEKRLGHIAFGREERAAEVREKFDSLVRVTLGAYDCFTFSAKLLEKFGCKLPNTALDILLERGKFGTLEEYVNAVNVFIDTHLPAGSVAALANFCRTWSSTARSFPCRLPTDVASTVTDALKLLLINEGSRLFALATQTYSWSTPQIAHFGILLGSNGEMTDCNVIHQPGIGHEPETTELRKLLSAWHKACSGRPLWSLNLLFNPNSLQDLADD